VRAQHRGPRDIQERQKYVAAHGVVAVLERLVYKEVGDRPTRIFGAAKSSGFSTQDRGGRTEKTKTATQIKGGPVMADRTLAVVSQDHELHGRDRTIFVRRLCGHGADEAEGTHARPAR